MGIVTIIAIVLLLDVFVLFVGRVVTMEANQREIMRALSAQSDRPSAEAQRRVDAAYAKAWSLQAWGLGFAACVALLITGTGAFAVIRPSRSHPNQAMQLTASKPAVYASGVCRRERMLRGMHRGLAAADLVSR